MRTRTRIGPVLLLLALLALGFPAQADEGQGAPGADRGTEAAIEKVVADLAAVRFDPKPEKLIRDVHYVTSNEKHIGLLQEAASNRGGIQLGVGAEQNYLLAGWSRPDILVCMDFDQYITDLHVLYGHLFSQAETVEALTELWKPEQKEAVTALLAERVPDEKRLKTLMHVHRYSGKTVARHLERQKQAFTKKELATWLTDPEQYAFVRSLWQNGRVVALRGDLTGPDTLKQIGAAVRKHGRSIRLFYLSNAEYYFTYHDGEFRENMAALPFDDRSVVLHTHPTKTDYLYYHQSGSNFLSWATHKRVKWFRTVKDHARKDGETLRYVVEKRAEEVIAPPRSKAGGTSK